MMHKAFGDRNAAMTYLKLAVDANASFDVLQAAIARKTLAELGG